MKYIFSILLILMTSSMVMADAFVESKYTIENHYLVTITDENIQREPDTEYEAPINTQFYLGQNKDGDVVYTTSVVMVIKSPIYPEKNILIPHVTHVSEVVRAEDGHPVRLVTTFDPTEGKFVFEVSAGLPMFMGISKAIYAGYLDRYPLVSQMK